MPYHAQPRTLGARRNWTSYGQNKFSLPTTRGPENLWKELKKLLILVNWNDFNKMGFKIHYWLKNEN